MRTYAPSGGPVAYPAPDEFNFSINGISGSFYKNHKGLWVLASGSNMNLKISDTLTQDYVININGFTSPSGEITYPKSFSIKRIIYGFTITDENGVKYIFGSQPNSIDFSAQADPVAAVDTYRPNFVAKAWHLTKVILPDRREMNFTYSFDNMPTFKTFKNIYGAASGVNAGSIGSSSASSDKTPSLIRDFYVYPDKIITPEVEVKFYKSLSDDPDYDFQFAPWEQYASDHGEYISEYYPSVKHWYKLNRLEVRSRLTNKIVYALYPMFPDTSPLTRLHLLGIAEYGNEAIVGDETKIHRFEYVTNTLPSYGSERVDHWGYYNNLNYLTSVTSPFSYANLKNVYSQYRVPSADSVINQAEVLKKIIYPTGGSTTFFYEPHQYSQYVKGNLQSGFSLISTANAQAGGLRVKKIVSDPGDVGTSLIKEYFYVQDYLNGNTLSSGILSGRPTYFEEGSDGAALRFYKMQSAGILQPNNTNGNHITYSKIYEKNSDGGITEVVFSNHDNGSIDKSANAYLSTFLSTDELSGNVLNKLAFNSIEQERGRILLTRTYDRTKKLLEKVQYVYNDAPVRFDDKIRSIDFKSEIFGNIVNVQGYPRLEGSTEVIKMSASNIYAYYPYLKTKTTTTYGISANDSVNQTEEYFYTDAPYYKLRRTVATNSKNEVVKTEYKYPFDFPGTAVYQEMVSKNMIAPVIRKTDSLGTKQTSLSSTNFLKFNSTSPLYLPGSYQVQNRSFPLDTIYKFIKYDRLGNIIEMGKANNVKEVYLWGYKGLYPVAKIIGNKSFDEIISLSGLDTAQLSNPASDGSLRSYLGSLRNIAGIQVSIYTYQYHIGMTSETNVGGRTIYYEYDRFGKLKLVKDDTGKVIKKYCYNYAGNLIDCATGVSTGPSWTPTGLIRCGKDANNNNTGYQERQERDINENSITFDQLRWVNIGINLTACPVANPIYARGRIENTTSSSGSEFGDLYVDFFSDANYTVPVSVTNLNVNYELRKYACDDEHIIASDPGTKLCNGTSTFVGNVELHRNIGGECWGRDYFIRQGNGYLTND
ncbi:hypothetical protein A8C56_02820 [Niabella ginsenosidivorans]|uniref:Uncharacterized protein n=2 Tax=Niabella ginsenosidivorans TaxID=1176587 RepID=A0A1A9HXE3_9BACT|nr:hypothetical protein A8C56_02820 [Niabella ginsenosidivorans]